MATTGIRGVFMEGTKVSVVVITEAITPPPTAKSCKNFVQGVSQICMTGMTARQRNYSKFGICIPRMKILSFKVSLLIGCRPEVERGVAHLVASTEQVARPATKRFHPSQRRPLEACCRPWTWWSNDATAAAGYATMMLMMMRGQDPQRSHVADDFQNRNRGMVLDKLLVMAWRLLSTCSSLS